MPEYTDHERTQLHAKARQQIRLVTLADNPQAASNRRFNVLGLLQGLHMAGALTEDQANALLTELQTTTVGRIDALTQQVLRDTRPPEPGQ
jgi:hypothetical protein